MLIAGFPLGRMIEWERQMTHLVKKDRKGVYLE